MVPPTPPRNAAVPAASGSRSGRCGLDTPRGGRRGSWLGKLGEPAFEKPPLRLLPRERESALEGGAGIRGPSEPPAQLRPRRVCQAIIQQIAPLENGVDEGQPGGGAVP